MKILHFLKTVLLPPEQTIQKQSYQEDKKYIYCLLLITVTGDRWRRIFCSSVPLETGHRIVLAPEKIFTVWKILHVVYPEIHSEKLTRPTTFVHAGVKPSKESIFEDQDLPLLGFSIVDSLFPFTIH